MSKTITREEKIDILEQALDLFARAAELLEKLGEECIRRTVVAELQGREGGWAAHTAADVLRDALRRIREGGEDEEEAE